MNSRRRKQVQETITALDARTEPLENLLCEIEREAEEVAEEYERRAEEAAEEFKRQVDEVEQQLTMLRKEREKLASEIAPIHNVPDELLVHIWTYNLYTDVDAEFKSETPFMIIASWVSARWRRVAIHTPSLWRDVHIAAQLQEDLVTMQLERSKNCSLVVTVHKPPSSYSPSIKNRMSPYAREHHHMNVLLHLVSAQISRWRIFHLVQSDTCSAKYIQDMVTPLRNTYAPRLEQLCIRFIGPKASPQPLSIGLAPVLSVVDFETNYISMPSSNLTCLTHLSLAHIAPTCRPTHAEFGAMLNMSPLLTNLCLRGVCVDYRSTPALHCPVTHVPSLRSLTIAFTNKEGDFVERFFAVFSTPELHSLSIESLEFHALVAFIDAPSKTTRYPVLSELSLGHIELVDPEISHNNRGLDFIRSMPSISSLMLRQSHALDVLALLTKYDNACASVNDACWPCLRTLRWGSFFIDKNHPIQAFVSQRFSMGIPITKFQTNKSFATFFGRILRDYNVDIIDCDPDRMYR